MLGYNKHLMSSSLLWVLYDKSTLPYSEIQQCRKQSSLPPAIWFHNSVNLGYCDCWFSFLTCSLCLFSILLPMGRRRIPVNFPILTDAISEKNHLIEMRDTYRSFLYKIFTMLSCSAVEVTFFILACFALIFTLIFHSDNSHFHM